jgi:hypothetical protein
MINRVSCRCKQEIAVEKSVMLCVCSAHERRANYWGVSDTTMKEIGRENSEGNEGSPLDRNSPRKTEQNVIVDDFYLCVVRRRVADLCVFK